MCLIFGRWTCWSHGTQQLKLSSHCLLQSGLNTYCFLDMCCLIAQRYVHVFLMLQEFDLRSAVLLEQAAYCYLNMSVPHIRKFAFYMVLAGHRYSKSCQRKHSLRCYNIALQVYEGKKWSLAEVYMKALNLIFSSFIYVLYVGQYWLREGLCVRSCFVVISIRLL